MTPSQQCKQAGLRSLAEFSRISGVKVRTLRNWHTQRPRAFEVMLRGARITQQLSELRDSKDMACKMRIAVLEGK